MQSFEQESDVTCLCFKKIIVSAGEEAAQVRMETEVPDDQGVGQGGHKSSHSHMENGRNRMFILKRKGSVDMELTSSFRKAVT